MKFWLSGYSYIRHIPEYKQADSKPTVICITRYRFQSPVITKLLFDIGNFDTCKDFL